MKWIVGFVALVISTFLLTKITVWVYNLDRTETISFPDSPFKPDGHRLIFAHRGLTENTTENTMPSFEAADALGTDVLETDVQMSSDGVVVIFHDDDMKRMTGSEGPVSGRTLQELMSMRLPAGCQKCDQIPTLAELLERFPDKRLNIELKTSDLTLARKVASMLAERQDRKDVIVVSTHPEAIQEFRRHSSLPTGATTGEVVKASLCYMLGARCQFAFQALQLPYRPNSILPALRAEPEFLDWAHRRGLRVDYWTINDEAEMKVLVSRHLDGIMTDRPAAALAVRKEFTK